DDAAEFDGFVDSWSADVGVAARDGNALRATAGELLDGLGLLLGVLVGRRLPIDADFDTVLRAEFLRRGLCTGIRRLKDRVRLAFGDQPDGDLLLDSVGGGGRDQ